ncbi:MULTISPECIES: HNH endonuclease [Haloarcula]|uniref:HNH endonuclease n=1 Tax=Haloarcula TaxID=2237 RepID=UPI0013DFF464|nr:MULTISPECIES: HNH endonuclease [Haloarcula]NHX41951.1 hypothetical protein [Haloarcula sp. R1-2]
MEIGKSFAHDELSWSIRYEADKLKQNGDFSGEIEIKILEPDEMKFPVKSGIRHTENYISFESENPEVEFNSDKARKLEFNVQKRGSTGSQQNENREKDGEDKKCEIWFTDGEKGRNYGCTFVPKEIISLSLQILSEDTDENEVKRQIEEVYDADIPAYTSLRRKSRYCTDFADHVEVLNFLYKHTNPGRLDRSIEQEIFSFIKDRVIEGKGGHQAYTSNSVSDLKEKIEICESKSFIPDIPNKDELIGLQHLKHTNNFVDAGEFEEAKTEISKAIDQFDQTDSQDLLPAELKRDAIQGLHDESKCNFEAAAIHYSSAAEKAKDKSSIRAYRVWSKVAKIKDRLNQGDIKEAKSLVEKIDYDNKDIYLIDLQKLTELFDVYSKYKQGKQSDPATIFNKIEVKDRSKLPTSDGIVQFNTDFSSAFTMLITKQRRQQLGVDSGIDDDFHTIIRDAITPTGISGNPKSEKQPEQGSKGSTQQPQDDGGMEAQSESDFERSYTEAKRAQRDSQFQEDVKEVYNQTCAVCGSDRMTPDGRPEVEAAHIRPVSEGGRDVITNGIALCRLHHWAFDNDWISIDDDYTVTVKDVPEVSGYEDFVQHQGSRLNLPESDEDRPDKDVIEFHRRHHRFEDDG